jgi:hypothetical protein
MIKHSMEWNEILGDMVDDVREEESRIEVHEAIADEQELTSADLDDWYTQLLTKEHTS